MTDAIAETENQEKVIQDFVKLWRTEIEQDPGALINLLFELGETKAFLFNRGLHEECDGWRSDHQIRVSMAREEREALNGPV